MNGMKSLDAKCYYYYKICDLLFHTAAAPLPAVANSQDADAFEHFLKINDAVKSSQCIHER